MSQSGQRLVNPLTGTAPSFASITIANADQILVGSALWNLLPVHASQALQAMNANRDKIEMIFHRDGTRRANSSLQLITTLA